MSTISCDLFLVLHREASFLGEQVTNIHKCLMKETVETIMVKYMFFTTLASDVRAPNGHMTSTVAMVLRVYSIPKGNDYISGARK